MSLKFHLQNIPFELEHELCFRWNKAFKRRPSSVPFLSGDTYRALCDVLYDDTHLCTASDIFLGSKVFVSSRLLDDFAKYILPEVSQNFTLITHQGDTNITNDTYFRAISENPHLNHWFAQNCTLEHPKVTPLPIGLEDRWRHNAGALTDFKKFTKNKKKSASPLSAANNISARKAEILVGFSMGTNPDSRFKCYRALWGKPFVHEIYNAPNAHLYHKILQHSMFVASPAGNGLDCHRTWEAMYLKTVPIVEDNYMNRFFASLGLPLLCIKDWTECKNWTEDFLKNTYKRIMQNTDTSALYSAWWEDKIKTI